MIIPSYHLYLCYTLFCYIKDTQCKPKGTNQSYVSTTLNFIIQLESAFVPFFLEDTPTSRIQRIIFQCNSPMIPKMSSVALSFIHTAVGLFNSLSPIFHIHPSQQEASYFFFTDIDSTTGGDVDVVAPSLVREEVEKITHNQNLLTGLYLEEETVVYLPRHTSLSGKEVTKGTQDPICPTGLQF